MWALKPQTEIKHKLLTGYLGRWIPILAQRRRRGERITYIDGFAGPGRYSKGEPGSPLLVLHAALEHTHLDALLARPQFEMVFTFIEMDKPTCQQLRQELSDFVSDHPLPDQFQVIDPIHGEFNEQMNQVLEMIEEQRRLLAPAFVFIDPFGPSGFPFRTIQRIVRNPSCEVLIRFNYSRLANNFLRRPELESRVDDLYGVAKWREARALPAVNREPFLIGLYTEQLKGPGQVEFVQSFRTVDPTGHIAHFVFATNNPRGFEEMKEAMWKVDPEGLFRWRAKLRRDTRQASFLTEVADSECEEDLVERLRSSFLGRKVLVLDLEDFVRREPVLLIRHLRPALKRLELSGLIRDVVRRSGKPRRKGTFPTDAVVAFR